MDGAGSTAILPPSARRARRPKVVCVECHSKKVKCDLEARIGVASATCIKCILDGVECRRRVSRRGNGAQRHTVAHHAADVSFSSESRINDALQLISHERRASSSTLVPSSFAPATSGSTYPQVSLPRQWTGTASTGMDGNMNSNQAVTINETTNVQSSAASTGNPSYTFLGDSGYMQILSGNQEPEKERPNIPALPLPPQPIEVPSVPMQRSFIETYFEYCYPWCPVVDPHMLNTETYTSKSLLLKLAMALVGSHISPPIISRVDSSVYYAQAKKLFHDGNERDPIVCVASICLFYWGGFGRPNTFSMDTVFWWTGIAIRIAQQIRLHQEPGTCQPLDNIQTVGLRRRIFWTLYARERLTAISQGRPCMINLDDCDVKEPSRDDFPAPVDSRADTFISWVHLCKIIGKVAKDLEKQSKDSHSALPVPSAMGLVEWVKNLAPHLQLPTADEITVSFNRDVHQLHLPYLSTVILLHLTKSAHIVPKAYTAAILAATCMARIFNDFIHREHIRFLPAVSSWYIAIAILALLHARQVDCLAQPADADLAVLQTALKELANLRPSARMIQRGVERLLREQAGTTHVVEGVVTSQHLQVESAMPGVADFLPFVTAQTSSLASSVLLWSQEEPSAGFAGLDWTDDFTLQLEALREDTLNLEMDLFCR